MISLDSINTTCISGKSELEEKFNNYIKKSYHGLTEDEIIESLQELDIHSIVNLLINSFPKKEKELLIKEFYQGSRSEIGSYECSGFGCHQYSFNVKLCNGYIFTYSNEPCNVIGKKNFIIVNKDDENTYKLIEKLKKLQLWDSPRSNSIDGWRKILISNIKF